MSNDFLDAADAVADQPDRLADQFDEELADAQDDTASAARRHLVENDSVAFGLLQNSIVSVPYTTGLASGATPSVWADFDVVTAHAVRAETPYAAYVESGTGLRGRNTDQQLTDEDYPAPDFPPVDDILAWIQAKGITPYSGSGIDTQVGLAEAIANTIADVGTFGRPYLGPAVTTARASNQYRRALERGARRAARRLRV